MCLHINRRIHSKTMEVGPTKYVPKPMVAKTNWVCYKILTEPHEEFRHGNHYLTHHETPVMKLPIIFSGGMAVLTSNHEEYSLPFGFRLVDESGCFNVIENGIHAYMFKSVATNMKSNNQEVYACVIPMGSRYYIGELCDVVVSEKMIIFESEKTFAEFSKKNETMQF